MKIVKGNTVEEQIKHIDIILSRFSRRLHKTVQGIITPFSISDYVESPINDSVFKFMFPVVGEISTALIYVENMPKNGVDVSVVLESNGGGSRTDQLFSKSNSISLDLNLNVKGGDRISINVVSKDPEPLIGVWSSILWTPEIKNATIKRFLIDALDNVEKENAMLKEE